MILEKVFREFNRRKVRYLVAGGVAAILYGNPRFTKDLDLFVDLEETNLKKLIAGFKALGFIPRVPVTPEAFTIRENRERWAKEKGMLAFTFINPKNPFENVDILTTSPIAFDRAYRRKRFFQSGRVKIPTVAAEDLIQMKRHAGREQDFRDIEILEESLKRQQRK